MEDRKSKILSEIDRDREELEELSRKIHDDPELGFEEFHALSYISDVLKSTDTVWNRDTEVWKRRSGLKKKDQNRVRP